MSAILRSPSTATAPGTAFNSEKPMPLVTQVQIPTARTPAASRRIWWGLVAATLTFFPLGAAAAPPALSAYGGKYFHETIGGYRFFANPTVVSAISSAVTDPVARREILSLETKGVTEPIRVSRGIATASACRPQHCDTTSFVIYVSTNPTAAAVCYESERVGRGKSAWYRTGRPPEIRGGSCPGSSAPPRPDFFSGSTGAASARAAPPVGRLKPGEKSYVQNAVFLRSADSNRPMHTFLSQKARVDQIRGEATVDCEVAAGGRLQNCVVTEETPRSYGIGEAAMKLQSGWILDMVKSKARPGQYVKMTAMFFPPYPVR